MVKGNIFVSCELLIRISIKCEVLDLCVMKLYVPSRRRDYHNNIFSVKRDRLAEK